MNSNDDDDRMSGLELQTIREYLGINIKSLAAILAVERTTIYKWEAGVEPIPYEVIDSLDAVEYTTILETDKLVASLIAMTRPEVVVYATDAGLHEARPDIAELHLNARWWRHVVARACYKLYGVRIVVASAA